MCARHKTRNLVVSIDGTSNQFGYYNTNVVELHSRILKDPPAQQLTYYISGIGTFVPPSFWSFAYWRQTIANKIDLAIAWNFEKKIQKAYRWLSDHYQPGDKIYLFGFSRGAYQVRVLAGMIERLGLLYAGNQELIPFAYELYANRYKGKENGQADKMADNFKRTFSRDIKVHFLGAWDTVSSIGIKRGKSPNLTESADHICCFRHALALDERRVKFLPEFVNSGPRSAAMSRGGKTPNKGLMSKDTERRAQDPVSSDGKTNVDQSPTSKQVKKTGVKEIWFAGSHSDIGGGKRANVDLDLASVPLLWMEKEAESAGLRLQFRSSGGEWDWGKLRDDMPKESLVRLWWALEWLPFKQLSYSGPATTTRWPHLGKGRIITNDQRIHASVAFKSSEYTPAASFLTNRIQWESFVGTGNLDDLSWSHGLEEDLEMDLFDSSSVAHTVQDLRESTQPEAQLHLLKRLTYMAWSVNGAEAIVKENGMVYLLSTLKHEDTKIQASGADCLGRLAKLGFKAETTDVIPLLAEMLKSEDIDVRISSLDCLSQMIDLKSAIWNPYSEPVRRILLEGNGAKVLLEMLDCCMHKIQSRSALCLARLAQDDDVRETILNADALSTIARMLKTPVTIWSGVTSLASFAEYEDARVAIHRTDTVTDLTRILAENRDSKVQDPGFDCLSKLAANRDIAKAILQTDVTSVVVGMLKNRKTQSHGAFYLSLLAPHDNLREAILRKGAIANLTKMLRSKDVTVLNSGACSLLSLAHYGENKAILETGAVQVLASMLQNVDALSQSTAAYYLPMLADHCDLRGAIFRTGTVTDLVKMLQSKDDSVWDEAARSLISLAKHAEFEKAILETEAISVIVCMLEDVNSDVAQTSAAFFLAEMANHDLLRAAILRTDAIADLAKLLQNEDISLRDQSAMSLAWLAHEGDVGVEQAILATDVIPTLASMLKKTDTQSEAAEVLPGFVAGNGLRKTMLRLGVIADLVMMLNSEFRNEASTNLAYLANYDDARAVMLEGDTISTSMTLLQSAEPSIRFWTTRQLLSIFCDYSDLRSALLKEDAISMLVRMMENETEYLAIRYAVSSALKNFVKYDECRVAVLNMNIIPTVARMISATETPIPLDKALTECGAASDAMRNQSNKLCVSEVGANLLIKLGVHEDTLPAILGADIVQAIPLLLQSDDYSCQASGALVLGGLAQFSEARSVILETDAIKALASLCHHKYSRCVQESASFALAELAKHDDIKAWRADQDPSLQEAFNRLKQYDPLENRSHNISHHVYRCSILSCQSRYRSKI